MQRNEREEAGDMKLIKWSAALLGFCFGLLMMPLYIAMGWHKKR